MADEEKEGKESSGRGNDWEVVSLTSSAYAAASGSEVFGVPADNRDVSELSKNETESSRALFMSDHFVFPPSEHENLPLESDNSYILAGVAGTVDAQICEIRNEFASEGTDTPEEEKDIIDKTGESWTTGEGLLVADSLNEIQFFEGKGKNFSAVHGKDFDWIEPAQHLGVGEEQNLSVFTKISSFHGETDKSGSTIYNEGVIVSELLKGDQEPGDDSLLSLDSSSDVKMPTENRSNESGLPCEAWWKKRAASLYAQAKEANTFWSVVVAAALMGLVILGQQWQQERWQVQQLKWRFSINDEKMNRMLGPISRLKDAIVGGHRRGPILRSTASVER